MYVRLLLLNNLVRYFSRECTDENQVFTVYCFSPAFGHLHLTFYLWQQHGYHVIIGISSGFQNVLKNIVEINYSPVPIYMTKVSNNHLSPLRGINYIYFLRLGERGCPIFYVQARRRGCPIFYVCAMAVLPIISVLKIRGVLHSLSVSKRGVVRSAKSRLEEWVVLLPISGLVEYVLEEGVARSAVSVLDGGLSTLLCLG